MNEVHHSSPTSALLNILLLLSCLQVDMVLVLLLLPDLINHIPLVESFAIL